MEGAFHSSFPGCPVGSLRRVSKEKLFTRDVDGDKLARMFRLDRSADLIVDLTASLGHDSRVERHHGSSVAPFRPLCGRPGRSHGERQSDPASARSPRSTSTSTSGAGGWCDGGTSSCRSREEHADRKLYLAYRNGLGSNDHIEVDVNFLTGFPSSRWWSVRGWTPDPDLPCRALVVGTEETLAGKVLALLDRGTLLRLIPGAALVGVQVPRGLDGHHAGSGGSRRAPRRGGIQAHEGAEADGVDHPRAD